MAEAILSGTDPTGRLGHPKFECLHCKQIFTRYPSTAKLWPPKYCGAKCKYEAFRAGGWPNDRQKFEVCCTVCGKKELVNPARAETRKFCSQKCMMVWRGPVVGAQRFRPETHVKLKCEICGDEFETPTSRIKDGRGRFCSRGCSGAWSTRYAQDRVSGAEKRFAADLEAVGLLFKTQHHVGRWTVDIVFEREMLAVEYDGEYWHSLPRSVERDLRKDAALTAKGYRVLRVPERLHIDNASAAVKMVVDALLELGTNQYERIKSTLTDR